MNTDVSLDDKVEILFNRIPIVTALSVMIVQVILLSYCLYHWLPYSFSAVSILFFGSFLALPLVYLAISFWSSFLAQSLQKTSFVVDFLEFIFLGIPLALCAITAIGPESMFMAFEWAEVDIWKQITLLCIGAFFLCFGPRIVALIPNYILFYRIAMK